MKKQEQRRRWGTAAVLVVVALASAGCPKPDARLEQVIDENDPARFISRVQARTAAVERMDARLELELKGAGGPFEGQFYGSFQMERRAGGLALCLQAYTVLGLPVLEVTVIGDRFQVYSPLEGAVFMNFDDLAEGQEVEELPLDSFEDVIVPLGLLKEQILLLYGLGFSPERRYELVREEEKYYLREYNGEELSREITYGERGPDILNVQVYDHNLPFGRMECFEHLVAPAEAVFFPSRLEVRRENFSIQMNFSRVRVNGQVGGHRISFRPVVSERVILLTPPLPG